jgi:hypothetical protein
MRWYFLSPGTTTSKPYRGDGVSDFLMLGVAGPAVVDSDGAANGKAQ